MKNICSRCTGWISLENSERKTTDDGKPLHLFCWYKLEQQKKEEKEEKGENP